MARLILTEEQVRGILSDELSDMVCESFSNGINLDGVKKKIKRLLLKGVAAAVILSAIAKMSIPEEQKVELRDEVKVEVAEIKKMDKSVLAEKVAALDSCITKYIKPHGHDISDIKFSLEHVIEACYRNNYDLPLLLAQMQCESGFGLKGRRCAQTNSPFSVGLYDNGKNVFKYASQNDAIDSYIRLMQNDYLVNGKSVDDLLKPGGFVNKSGKRYASDPNYERSIRVTRNSIIRNFPELAS